MAAKITSILAYGISGEKVTVTICPGSFIRGNGRSVDCEATGHIGDALGYQPIVQVSTEVHYPNDRSLELAGALAALIPNDSLVRATLPKVAVIGSLDGPRVIGVRNLVTLLTLARDNGCDAAIIPADNILMRETTHIMPCYPVRSVDEALDTLKTLGDLEPFHADRGAATTAMRGDFGSVEGYYSARRALEVAAAGHHHTLLVGDKRSGKSLLAALLPTIMPNLTDQEFELHARIESAAGVLSWHRDVPYDKPITGLTIEQTLGNIHGMPGAVSRVHGGVLDLNSVERFAPAVQRAIAAAVSAGEHRLEYRSICNEEILSSTVPTQPLVIGTLDNCRGEGCQRCRLFRNCQRFLTTDLLSLFQIGVNVFNTPPPADALPAEPSERIRLRVARARERQRGRYGGDALNGTAKHVMVRSAEIAEDALPLLHATWEKFPHTRTDHQTVLRIARTIADLDSSAHITASHLSEALSYRAPIYSLLNRLQAATAA